MVLSIFNQIKTLLPVPIGQVNANPCSCAPIQGLQYDEKRFEPSPGRLGCGTRARIRGRKTKNQIGAWLPLPFLFMFRELGRCFSFSPTEIDRTPKMAYKLGVRSISALFCKVNQSFLCRAFGGLFLIGPLPFGNFFIVDKHSNFKDWLMRWA